MIEIANDSPGVAMIAAERRRQVDTEGYTVDHDREHTDGELALAAAVYADKSTRTGSVSKPRPRLAGWPWADEDFKPVDRLTCLVKAGALIAAEIDRLTTNPTEEA